MPNQIPSQAISNSKGEKTIILTFATGQRNYLISAGALGSSLRLHHSTTTRVLITDVLEKNPDEKELIEYVFDEIIPPPSPKFKHWFIKLCALEHTDADRILFIDSDCLAVQNVDRILEELRGNDFAVMGRWRTAGQWYGDFESVMKRFGLSKVPSFNGGFMYYERNERTAKLIERILELAADYDSLGLKRNFGEVVDEVCIAIAMEELQIGTVIPESKMYSVTPWNKLQPVELDVLAGRCSMVTAVKQPFIQLPAIYHTAMGKWDLKYWREVRRVRKVMHRYLSNREHWNGFEKPWQKARRVVVEFYLRAFRLK